MYIDIRKPRRGVAGCGMGWTGGFTLPGSTTRYSTETCSGSAASPMTGGNMICGMQNEAAYLNSIGCVTVGFQGEHDCSTDAGSPGAIYCCPPGVLQAELTGGTSTLSTLLPAVGGAVGGQIAIMVGLAAIIGVAGYLIWKAKSEGTSAEEYLWGSEY